MQFKNPRKVLLQLILATVILCAGLAILFSILGFEPAFGEEYRPENDPELHRMYVMCQPNDYIHVRSGPKRKSREEGYLLPGYDVWVCEKIRNGYVYSPYMNNESGEGWIFAGYLVDEEPQFMEGALYYIVSIGRVAARKYIGGKRRCWLYNGDTVKVWYMTSEWCVTNKGFVMTKYLEADMT